MYRCFRVLVLFVFMVGFVSFAQAQNWGLPDYTHWPTSFTVTTKISFQGMEVDAHFLMYFNNELPREASQIVADFSMKLDDETHRFVQYVVVEEKDAKADMVIFKVELYHVHNNEMVFRGAMPLVMNTKEFYRNMLLPEEKTSPDHYDYDY